MNKTAGIFLINKNNELLICRVTNSNPEMWSIPKGLFDPNESAIEACIRECFEETNINLKDYNVLRYLPKINYKTKKKCLYPFVLFEKENKIDFNNFELRCDSLVNNDFPEVDSFQWISLCEAPKYIHETQIECLSLIENLILNNI